MGWLLRGNPRAGAPAVRPRRRPADAGIALNAVGMARRNVPQAAPSDPNGLGGFMRGLCEWVLRRSDVVVGVWDCNFDRRNT